MATQAKCPSCHGTGIYRGWCDKTCTRCGGTGTVPRYTREEKAAQARYLTRQNATYDALRALGAELDADQRPLNRHLAKHAVWGLQILEAARDTARVEAVFAMVEAGRTEESLRELVAYFRATKEAAIGA